MSAVIWYLLIGVIYAETGVWGHERKYGEPVTGMFYVFMVFTWPYLLFKWIRGMFS